MLPSPVAVCKALIGDLPTILFHAKFTLLESFYGLLIGIALAFIFATVMEPFPGNGSGFLSDYDHYPDHSHHRYRADPGVVDGLWNGTKDHLSRDHHLFPHHHRASGRLQECRPGCHPPDESNGRRQNADFPHVKFPSALPQFFSGLKISASYAVVGAVVSEWLGGFNGLGVYMTRVKKAYAFDKMFAVIIFIVIISLLLLFIVNVASRIAMPWLQVEKEKNHE